MSGKVRLWVDGLDYGTMRPGTAVAFMEHELTRPMPRECRVEPVEDGAPVFLPKKEEGE